jgi:2',3'-cyclic-nucleotide 2'-phosphodiesterase (5'-nucleotidase family)
MKRVLLAIVALLFVVSGASAHNPKAWRKMKQNINFLWASDLDRYGCYDQKVIANLMGEMAKAIKPRFILETGDTHHGNGVKSIHDEDWKERWEDIYNHPKLLKLDWVPVLGNHEYRGNTNAVLEYSKVNPRWTITERYYTRVIKKGNTTIRLVMIDTTPLIDKYRESKSYKDAGKQEKEPQLQWLDDVLSKAKEDWIIVAGHHPVYADTKKPRIERDDMKKAINSTLRKHKVAMYICGHIHSFQHIRRKGYDIDYLVNSSASWARDVKQTKDTKYCSNESGFSVITASKKRLSVHMIDKNGNILHTVNKTK